MNHQKYYEVCLAQIDLKENLKSVEIHEALKKFDKYEESLTFIKDEKAKDSWLDTYVIIFYEYHAIACPPMIVV
jgi:hypothetical protein